MKSDSQPLALIPTEAERRRGIPDLEELIRQEIRDRGPMTFARYMELALYHPQHGYYASGRARIGRNGDFFTNVTVGSIFGKLLAAQFAEIWEELGRPVQLTIVEQGAYDGHFAADVLCALRESDCFAALNYVVIEPFPVWQARQQEKLTDFVGKVFWSKSIDKLGSFTGIHFSNELFDSLPVHLLRAANERWAELFVTLDHAEFHFEEGSCSSCLQPPAASQPHPPYRTEVNLAASRLMQEIAAKLQRGVILTIDYGFTPEESHSPEHSAGTLQVRAQHRKLASPFDQVGMADISTHVQWSSLIEAAQSAGAELLGFTDQHHFLIGILSEQSSQFESLSAADKRSLQTLLHPEILGRDFQALALGKNFAQPLSGFRFARARFSSP